MREKLAFTLSSVAWLVLSSAALGQDDGSANVTRDLEIGRINLDDPGVAPTPRSEIINPSDFDPAIPGGKSRLLVGETYEILSLCLRRRAYNQAINGTVKASFDSVGLSLNPQHDASVSFCKDRIEVKANYDAKAQEGYKQMDLNDRIRCADATVEGFDQTDPPHFLTAMEEIARENKEFDISFRVTELEGKNSGNYLAVTGVLTGVRIYDTSERCQ